jgi:PRTRC genetic system protein A
MSDVFNQLFSSNREQVKIGAFPTDESYSFGVFGNGLFEKESIKKIGEFVTQVNSAVLPGIEKAQESFTFGSDFKKIPIGVLVGLIEFYRKVMKTISSEVMVMVVFDELIDDYKFIVPKQNVSGASVKYEHVVFEPHESFIISSHSHVNMPAFFSGTDDLDEKKAMLYGVIGKLSQELPEVKFRAKKGKSSFGLTIAEVFDDKDTKEYKIPEIELLKISQLQAVHHPVINYGHAQPRPQIYDYHNGNYRVAQGSNTSHPSNVRSRYNYYVNDPSDFNYDEGAFGSGSKKNGFSTAIRELGFMDPDAVIALEGFIQIYSDFIEKNFTLNLSDEELAEHYSKISNSLCSVLDSLDVEDTFFDIFYQDMFENEPLVEGG